MNQTKSFFCKLGIGIITTMIMSCGGGSDSVEIAKKLSSSYEYDGKTIEVTGRFTSPRMVWGGTDREKLNMILITQAAFNNTDYEQIFNIVLDYGDGKNNVKIDVPPDADEFKDTDIVLHDSDGNMVKTSDDVVLTGKVTYTAKGPKKESESKIKIPTSKFGDKDKNEDNNDYSYTVTEVSFKKK